MDMEGCNQLGIREPVKNPYIHLSLSITIKKQHINKIQYTLATRILWNRLVSLAISFHDNKHLLHLLSTVNYISNNFQQGSKVKKIQIYNRH